MSIINGVNMPNFTNAEIPPGKAKYMSKFFLVRIQEYRNFLGHPLNVSKAEGALIRFDGRETSRHYVKSKGMIVQEKLSTAMDVFPDCDIFEAWSKALSSNFFHGVGVYFDTRNNKGKPQPMLHLDLRSTPLMWYRDQGEYFYPHHEDFFKNLNKLLGSH